MKFQRSQGKTFLLVDPLRKTKQFLFDNVRLATGKLTLLEDYKEPPEKPEWASLSPDEKTVIFARNHNLFVDGCRELSEGLEGP